MGYRSEVVLGVKEEALNKVMNDKIKEALKDCDSIHKKDGNIYFKWEWAKWYDGYEDVDAITDMLTHLAHEDYGFLRIGEEDKDIEEQGEAYSFGISLRRNIDFPETDDLLVEKEKFFAPNSVKFICDYDGSPKKKASPKKS